MQNCLRWVRSHNRRRFPVVGTPYAPPSARPCGCRGVVASVRRCALCAWSVACGQSCGVCPRPPLCFAAARHQLCALVCPSAPRGDSLSPRACLVDFCYMFRSAPRTKYGGYRPSDRVSQRSRWLTRSLGALRVFCRSGVVARSAAADSCNKSCRMMFSTTSVTRSASVAVGLYAL